MVRSEVTKILEHNVEYELLPYQFFLLTLWGIWSPKNWSFKAKNIHKIYFTSVFFLSSLMCTEMLIYFISSLGTNYFKLINLFLVSANITGVYKAVKLMKNRDSLRYFITTYFDSEWMNPRNLQENEIYEKINLRIRNVTISYSASMIGVVLLKALSPLAESDLIVSLPVDAWYPYSTENHYWFWTTYLHQVILGSSAVSAHVGIDTLFVGLLLKTSCQIDVLKYRLKNLTKLYNKGIKNFKCFKIMEKKMICQCINHHKRIHRFGDDLNSQFQEILIILVISSLPNICLNVYALSVYKDDINIQYISTFFCTTSAFLQFFIPCWYGNEVSLNSIEIRSAVYEMDWTIFDVSTQKLLVVIMARSLKPIQFSVGDIIPINLNSFIKIIKSSYSAFSLLQQTSN